MTVWTEDQGSTYNFLDKQVDLPSGTTFRIKNSSSVDLVTVDEATGIWTMPFGFSSTGNHNVIGSMSCTLGLDVGGVIKVGGNVIKDNSGSASLTFNGSGKISNFDIISGTISGGLTWSSAQNLNNQALTNVNIDSVNIAGVTMSGGLTWLGSQDFDHIPFSNVNIQDGSVTSITIAGGLTWSAAQNLNNQALTNVNIDSGDISAATISGGLTWSSAQDLNNQSLTNINITSGTVGGSLTWNATQTISGIVLSQVYGGIEGTPASTNFHNVCIHKDDLKMDDSDIIFDVDGTENRWIRFRSNEFNETNGTLHIRADNIFNEDNHAVAQYANDLTLSCDGYLNIYADNAKDGSGSSPSIKIFTQPQTINSVLGGHANGISIFTKRNQYNFGSYIDIGHNQDEVASMSDLVDIRTHEAMANYYPINDGYRMSLFTGMLNLDWAQYTKIPFRDGSTGSYSTKGFQSIAFRNDVGVTIEGVLDERFHQVYSTTAATGAGLVANHWSLYSSHSALANDEYDRRPDFTDKIKFTVNTANGNTTIQGSFEAVSNIKTHGYFHQLGAEMILGDSSTVGDRITRYSNSAGNAYIGIDRSDQAFCMTNGSFPTVVNDHHFKIATDGTARFKNNVDFASTLTCSGLITGGSLGIDDLRMNNQTISTVAGDAENNHSLTISTSGPIDDIILDTQSSVFVTIGNADLFKVMRQVDDANLFSVSQAGVIKLVNGETIDNTTDNQVQITSQNLKLGTDGDTVLQDNAMNVDGDWIFTGTGDVTITSAATKDIALAAIGTGEIQLTSAEKIRLDGTTVLGDAGYVTITDNEIDVSSGDLTIDVAGDIVIDADGDNIDFKTGGNTVSKGVHAAVANTWYWYENNAGGEDSLSLEVKANGESTIQTKDVAGSDAHLNFIADGNITTSSENITNNITTDYTINVGRNMLIDAGFSLDIDADTGVKFNTGVGFTRLTPTFNASITSVAFGQSNKQYLTLTANLTGELRMVFPNTSGNFTLLVKQDATGSRTIAAWKTFDQNIGNEASVVWAGGSAPTLTTTANKLDIVSFYWDNDNHIAYGVITKNF